MVRSDETVCAAFDAGINFFFVSADLHWPGYESARRGLAKLLARKPSVRDEIVVAVVSYVTQPEFCERALQEGLEAIPGLKSIDVGVIGGAYSDEFLTRLEVYAEIRRDGLLGLRALGTTFHDRAAALLAINHQLVDLAFIRYNPTHMGAKSDVFPHLTGLPGTLLYNFKSTLGFMRRQRYAELGLDDKHWRPEITDYYRFALSRPEIDGLLCSPTTQREVRDLSRALAAGPLDEEEENYLIDLAMLDAGAVLITDDAANSLQRKRPRRKHFP